MFLLNKTKGAKPKQKKSFFISGKKIRLYEEDIFLDMLSRERKRSERSGDPMLLMLLDLRALMGNNGHAEEIAGITQAICKFTRETDIKGWHSSDSILGVIFTEIKDWDITALREKVIAYLSDMLDSKQASKIRITFHIFPENSSKAKDAAADVNLYPDLSSRSIPEKIYSASKRVIDILGGITGLLLFSPFFIMIPVLIKATSKGPVLFRQERVGRYGRKFTFLKFRTMHVNNNHDIHREYIKKYINGKADSDSSGNGENKKVYKITNDPRVTTIGRFLRKTSFDELPQFLNVLKGEMSLVGPRPPIPYEIENYNVWHKRRVVEVKPGITGLWQVFGRSSTTFDEMVRLDLRYINECSLWLDIKIIVKTPFAVFTGKGAY